MSKSNSSTASGGIGFSGLLAVLFIGLKLTHVIDWSWWWVLAPLWGPVALIFAFLAFIGLVYAVSTVCGPRSRWPHRR